MPARSSALRQATWRPSTATEYSLTGPKRRGAKSPLARTQPRFGLFPPRTAAGSIPPAACPAKASTRELRRTPAFRQSMGRRQQASHSGTPTNAQSLFGFVQLAFDAFGEQIMDITIGRFDRRTDRTSVV